MKVLWVCNIPLPTICDKLGIPSYNIGSWIESSADMLLKDRSIDLYYLFHQEISDELLSGEANNVYYYGVPKKRKRYDCYKRIIAECSPDILHIFGTENPYSYDVARIFSNPQKTIINIQGLTTTITKHYTSGLPWQVVYGFTLRDIIRRNNVYSAVKYFRYCSGFEKKLIKYASNFIGRTDFDRAIVSQIHPDCKYFLTNETLRSAFYEDGLKWNVEKCEKHSIFISQAQYPVKGLHYMVEALPIIKQEFPDVKLYIAGNTIRIIPKSFKDKLIQTSYAKYLWNLIKKYRLQDSIVFLGSMDSAGMKQKFLHSNVFVLCSTIENESNSLSEAKILGIPTVASFVGGVTRRIENGFDGFLYPHDEPYMLAYYVGILFRNEELCKDFSKKSIANAEKLFAPQKNKDKLLQIYNEVWNNNEI